MRPRSAVLAGLCALLVAAPAFGQAAASAPRDSTVAVHLKDGSLILGRLIDQTTDSVRLMTSAGRVTLARSAVAEIKAIDPADIHAGAYWTADPHDTRLFFGPTGRTLSGGTGYFSDLYLFLITGAWGVTDRITLGAGTSLFPGTDFFRNNVYYVTPKVALVRGESFNLAAGALIGFAGRANGSAGIYYLAATSGRADASVTYGLGYSYFNSRVSGDATLMLGGTLRVARRVSLMTENYVFTGGGDSGGYWVPMYGVRFIGEHLSADLGFLNFTGRGSQPIFPGIPWLGFAVKF
jgi:hypothetical protein